MERKRIYFRNVPIGGYFYYLEEMGTRYQRIEERPSGANALRLGEVSSSECKVEWGISVFVEQVGSSIGMAMAC